MTSKFCHTCDMWTVHAIVEAFSMKFYICKKHRGDLLDDTNGVVPELLGKNQPEQYGLRSLQQEVGCAGAD